MNTTLYSKHRPKWARDASKHENGPKPAIIYSTYGHCHHLEPQQHKKKGLDTYSHRHGIVELNGDKKRARDASDASWAQVSCFFSLLFILLQFTLLRYMWSPPRHCFCNHHHDERPPGFKMCRVLSPRPEQRFHRCSGPWCVGLQINAQHVRVC